MKKIILSLVCLFALAIVANAEEPLTNKRGQRILPQAGDVALGVDATPFLNYLGNFFGKRGQNTNGDDIFNGKDQSIYLKYFLSSNSALRFALDMNIGKTIDKGLVPDEGRILLGVQDATALDVQRASTNRFMLRGGYEMRRGYGRLQGFWGAEVGLGMTFGRTKWDYANAMNAANTTPTTSDFTGGIYNPAIRTLLEKNPIGYTAYAGGFVGVEYFFAPKISVAGQFGLGWDYTAYSKGGQYNVTYQTYDSAYGMVEYEKRESSGGAFPNTGEFSTLTKGSLSLFFHF